MTLLLLRRAAALPLDPPPSPAPTNERHQGCLAQELLRLQSPELCFSSQQLLWNALLATRSTVRNLNTSCVSDLCSRRLRSRVAMWHYSLHLLKKKTFIDPSLGEFAQSQQQKKICTVQRIKELQFFPSSWWSCDSVSQKCCLAQWLKVLFLFFQRQLSKIDV